MTEIVKLKVAKNESATEKTLKAWDERAHDCRTWLEKYPTGGFMIVAYVRDGTGMITSTAYHVTDTIDIFVLPHLAEEKIRSAINDAAAPA